MPAKQLPQRKRVKIREQATKKPMQGFKAAPPKLREIIELVDLVDPDDVLEPIEYRPPPAGEEPTDFLAQKEAEIRFKTRGLPKRFVKYVLEVQPDGLWFVAGAVKRYEEIRTYRENLRVIARVGSTPLFLISLNSKLYLFRNPQTGEQRLIPDKFRTALDEEGVEINCIRECAVCRRIYYEDRLTWKGKITKPACWEHAQTLRSRWNYKPVKTDAIGKVLPSFLKQKGRRLDSLTDADIKELSGWAGVDATERQTRKAVEYLQRKKAG